MFGADEARHGWERKGESNKPSEPVTELDRLIRQYIGTKPFIGGAFMTKYKERYYLQYAVPVQSAMSAPTVCTFPTNPRDPLPISPTTPFPLRF